MEEMTASKMLRDACDAPGGLDPRPEQMLAKLGWRLAGSCGHYTFSSSDAARSMCDLFGRLADKIDIELAEARKSGFDDFKLADWYYSADANGWPKPRDDESLHEYVDRCFIPRPRFEDGEPVQSSDIEEIGALATCRVYMDGSWEFDPDKYEDERNPKPWDVQSGAKSDRIKRPAPEVLGADGLPLNEDDTVYGTGREQHRYTVQVPYSINEVIGQRFCVQCYDHDEGNITWCDPSMLTHTPPDTLERLRDDMYRTAEEWREADSVSVTDMNHWANRLTALIERMGGAE